MIGALETRQSSEIGRPMNHRWPSKDLALISSLEEKDLPLDLAAGESTMVGE